MKIAEDGRVIFKYLGDVSPLDEANSKAEGKFSKMGGIAAKALAAVGAAAVAAGTAIVKSGVQFESAFAGVLKTVDGTENELKALRDGILDMSEMLPATASEIAAVAEAAGQLGIQTDNVLAFSRTMIDLGEATNLSADQAATALARFANIMQMPQTEFDKLGSSIVALGNNFATTEAEIVEMGMRLAGAGQQAGMSEADIMGFAAALSSVGIEAEAGGTALSKVITDINVAVQTGNDKLKQYADVAGMSAEEFRQAFQKDAAGAVAEFVKGLGRMEERGSSAILMLEKMEIKEVRMRDALLRASGAGDLLTSAIDLSNAAWEENIALTEEAEKRYETVESQFAMLKNQVTNIGIALYEDMREPLVGVMEALRGAFDALEKSGALDAFGETLGGLAETLGGLAVELLPIFVELINLVIPIISQLVDAILPALVSLTKSLMPLIEKIIESFLPVLVEILDELLPPLVEIANILIPILINVLDDLSEPLLELILDLLPPLVELLELIIELIEEMEPGVELLSETLSQALANAVEVVTAVVGDLMDSLRGLMEYMQGIFSGDWERVWNGALRYLRGIANSIIELINALIKSIIYGINQMLKSVNGIAVKVTGSPLTSGIIGSANTPQIPRLRVGMDYVPEDDFPALLHRGEMVLTAGEASDYRAMRAEGALSAEFMHSAAVRDGVNITIGDINIETSAQLNTLSGARQAGNLLGAELDRELRNRGWNP